MRLFMSTQLDKNVMQCHPNKLYIIHHGMWALVIRDWVVKRTINTCTKMEITRSDFLGEFAPNDPAQIDSEALRVRISQRTLVTTQGTHIYRFISRVSHS